MEIGIVSDTHNNLKNIDKIIGLFNEEKVIFISFKKNRLNKEILNKFQLIMEYVTKNTIVVDIPNLTKNTIEKELINHKDGNAIFIDCFMPFESEVRKFLESNLPNYLKKTEYIKHLIEMYEGNFSLFLNDFEILNLLKIDNADIAMQVFSKNVNKGNSKLIEYICKKDAKLALSVIQFSLMLALFFGKIRTISLSLKLR